MGRLININGGQAGVLKLPGKYNFTIDWNPANPVVPDNCWTEKIDNESPNVDEWGVKFASSTLVGYVNDDAMYDMVNSALGYSYTDTANGYAVLRRVNPICHPKYKNLYAARVTDSQGNKFESRTTSIVPPQNNAGLGINKYANYKIRKVKIQFQPLRFPILEDTELQGLGGGEYLRNTEYGTKPNVYDVTMQTGQFFFVEGAAGNPGPPNAKSFPGELNFFEVKTTFNVNWRAVPENFLCDTSFIFSYPTKLVAAAGKVNSVAFGNYPAGTLLILEPEIDRYISGTLRTEDGRTPVFMYDVMLPIIHFDPPTYNNAKAFQGHNLKPYWATGVTSLVYYLVTSNDSNTTGIRIYSSYDYNKVFKSWDSP